MRSTNQVPIMTNSESILQFGNNAYGKPATALNILRETILGRQLFDYAFKEYARRWQFKRPMPADLFRTMEDASGIDLDWFWRGWFYTSDHVDIAVENVRLYELDTKDPDVEKAKKKAQRDKEPNTVSDIRNAEIPKRLDAFPILKDFYNDFDELDVTPPDRAAYQKFLEGLEDNERESLKSKQNFYVVDFRNIGGLVMPIVLEIEYEDESKDQMYLPAEIWRRDSQKVSKLFITSKLINSLVVDPHLQTADVDLENNYFPRRVIKSRFELFKEKKKKNPMQKAAKAKQKKK